MRIQKLLIWFLLFSLYRVKKTTFRPTFLWNYYPPSIIHRPPSYVPPLPPPAASSKRQNIQGYLHFEQLGEHCLRALANFLFFPKVQGYLLSHTAVDLVHKDDDPFIARIESLTVDGDIDENATSSWLPDLELRDSKSAKHLANPDPLERWGVVRYIF